MTTNDKKTSNINFNTTLMAKTRSNLD